MCCVSPQRCRLQLAATIGSGRFEKHAPLAHVRGGLTPVRNEVASEIIEAILRGTEKDGERALRLKLQALAELLLLALEFRQQADCEFSFRGNVGKREAAGVEILPLLRGQPRRQKQNAGRGAAAGHAQQPRTAAGNHVCVQLHRNRKESAVAGRAGRSSTARPSGNELQAALQIGNQILDIFDAHRKTHESVTQTDALAHLWRHRSMRHGSGMANQTFHTAQAFREGK